jgi:hypothetical protein
LLTDNLLELVNRLVAVKLYDESGSETSIVHIFVGVVDSDVVEKDSLVESCVGNQPVHAVALRVVDKHFQVGEASDYSLLFHWQYFL